MFFSINKKKIRLKQKTQNYYFLYITAKILFFVLLRHGEELKWFSLGLKSKDH